MERTNGFDGISESLTAIDSDYGSDIDDDTWDAVLVQAEWNPLAEVAIEDLQDLDVGHGPKSRIQSLRLPRSQISSSQGSAENEDRTPLQKQFGPDQVPVNQAGSQPQSPLPTPDDNVSEHPGVAEQNVDDSQTPLQRFRTLPKKPLSVTDFVSPAWCELQYWYSLTRYGRVRRTPAMKAGTKIHKEKEREVHVEVPVETRTREDRMGLRLWNIIQGLRALRSNGLTRELEVFGLVDGEIVIGVIDEITATCPNEEMEASILGESDALKQAGVRKNAKKEGALPADQRTLKEFLQSSQTHDVARKDEVRPLTSFSDRLLTHYLVDIKTRGANKMPHKRQMKPAMLQLMMYRRMLIDLAANELDAELVFQRYQLNRETTFSDTFIAGLANIEAGSTCAESDEAFPTDPLDEIISHNTLGSLWSLMIEEFARTLPTQSLSLTISPMLTVEYRSSRRNDLLGRKCFGFDAGELSAHAETTLDWWRGKRPAKGVEIEDAWKCGMCEFAERCTWRADKIEQATRQARIKNQARTEDST